MDIFGSYLAGLLTAIGLVRAAWISAVADKRLESPAHRLTGGQARPAGFGELDQRVESRMRPNLMGCCLDLITRIPRGRIRKAITISLACHQRQRSADTQ
jgi:hypothetical protein